MISIDALSVEFGVTVLFDKISYVINKKDRIALVGRNGAGKSTMLKILAGVQKQTGGNVTLPRGVTIGYLPQHMPLNDSRTLFAEAEEAFSEIFELQRRIEQINRELETRTDYESREYHDLIDEFSVANEHMSMMGAMNYQAEIEKTLQGLGFMREDFQRPTAEFSGGWRMRIELAKILLRRPDLLLLDEPTNHLDIESIQWLENFLATSGSTVMLVSHDRAFIDNVTNRTLEISLGDVHDYKVNYSKYLELRAERMDQQMRAYENQRKQIQETEDFIERFRYKASKSVQVQSRIKQLAKVDRIEVDEVDRSRLSLKFPPAPRSGDYPLILENVGKSYGAHRIFSGATFSLKRGEKIALVGKNGEGKTTLVKCIMDQIEYDGNLKTGYNVKIGYYAQNQAQQLDGEITVFETIDNVAVGDIRTKIRDILGAFMFGGEASDKKVKVLSGGERARLAMIKLLLEPVNLLILDEPTNHLDMSTKDVLKQAIKSFDGTVIVVSHDREFLDGLVSKVYEFGGGKVKEHLGGIYDFLQRKKIDSLSELERKKTVVATEEEPKEQQLSDNKLNYEQRKELQRKIKQLQNSVNDAEKRVQKTEAKISEIEVQLSTAEGFSNIELCRKHGELNRELGTIMEYWSEQSEKLEALKKVSE